jgi:integrase
VVGKATRRKVEKRLPDFLRADEVPRVLNALADRWRPLFATAVYTGMRRGELLGLRKSDIDLASGLISVSRSHGRETTKGQRAEAIPVAGSALGLAGWAASKFGEFPEPRPLGGASMFVAAERHFRH